MSNDPKIDDNKLTRAVPEDPSTGEPQDEKPLYYRARAKSMMVEI